MLEILGFCDLISMLAPPVAFCANPLRENLGKSLRFRWWDRINVALIYYQLLLGQRFKNISSSSTISIE
jgi:hypothetical protein